MFSTTAQPTTTCVASTTTREHIFNPVADHRDRDGIAIETPISAGGYSNHAEGIVVATLLKAGIQTCRLGSAECGDSNHAEGIVVTSQLKAGIQTCRNAAECADGNHAEGIVVTTPVKAGGLFANHAEGIVVTTPVKAGGLFANHAEGIVVSRQR